MYHDKVQSVPGIPKKMTSGLGGWERVERRQREEIKAAWRVWYLRGTLKEIKGGAPCGAQERASCA